MQWLGRDEGHVVIVAGMWYWDAGGDVARILNGEDGLSSTLWLWAVTGMQWEDMWELIVIGTQNGMDGSSWV